MAREIRLNVYKAVFEIDGIAHLEVSEFDIE
jgi:hypothetical protein